MWKLLPACLLVVVSVLAVPQTTKSAGNTVKDKYHVIEVNDFEVQPGVKLPADYFANLQDELVKQFEKSHEFEAVLRPGEEPPTAGMLVLRLTGVITEFKKGSRAKRYLGGPALGSAQIIAHTRYIDRATGDTVIEGEVTGTLTGGLFGGSSKKVIHEFATAVVTTTKMTLLRKPAPAKAEAVQPAAAAERTALDITPGDLDAKQQALNDFSARGFRITDYASTGNKSATLTLEKGTDPSQVGTYLMFQTKRAGTLERELNAAAADGYRLVPHTLAFLGGFFAIAEKPVTPRGVRYQYKFHVAIRESNAEKDIKADQARGFVLIDVSKALNGTHWVILEKETALETPQTQPPGAELRE